MQSKLNTYCSFSAPTFRNSTPHCLSVFLLLSLSTDEDKNALCQPVPIPNAPIDWLKLILNNHQNRAAWLNAPEMMRWLYGARLDGFTAMFVRAKEQPSPENDAILERYVQAIKPGLTQIAALLATEGR